MIEQSSSTQPNILSTSVPTSDTSLKIRIPEEQLSSSFNTNATSPIHHHHPNILPERPEPLITFSTPPTQQITSSLTQSTSLRKTDPIYSNSNFTMNSPAFTRVINSTHATKPHALHTSYWEGDAEVDNCFKCDRGFGIFFRRHHCRRCGLIYCDNCSSSRAQLHSSDFIYDPTGTFRPDQSELSSQRVCDTCYILIRSGPRVPPVEVPVAMKRTDSMASILTECPVCAMRLISVGMSKEAQELHISQCLEGNSLEGAKDASRYLVFTLDDESPLLGQECSICLVEFESSHRIARLNCLCCFHRDCIQEWFFQNSSCPIHFN